MPEMQENSISVATGTIIFLEKNIGSKNQGSFPFLYINRTQCYKLFFNRDNPFENTQLQNYDGKKVTVEGKISDTRTFVIEKITEC